MGKAIEEIALQRGHSVILKIDAKNRAGLSAEQLQQADVAIEFTGPDSAVDNIMQCLEAGVPVLSGSTGWLEQLETVHAKVKSYQGTFLYASNFSIGVNIFFELNKKLAALMAGQPGYDVSIKEIHHTAKKDAPSGTAITLAEQVLAQSINKKSWNLSPKEKTDLAITSIREDPAPGTHYVNYRSVVDEIEIIHTAHTRQGFAQGAVMAAEFIFGKKGTFTMQEVLGIQ